MRLQPTMKLLHFLCPLVLTLTVHGAESPRILLQQGLFEEEANRDLDKASLAYSMLVSEYDALRNLAATALFRLAEIRSKQGNKPEAIALHQRLVTEFPSQERLVALSRERLAFLGGALPVQESVKEAITSEENAELVRIIGRAEVKARLA
ncbi:MAG: tetratricopeptide repeat protein, partial [Verrucomicrobiota bacterium]